MENQLPYIPEKELIRWWYLEYAGPLTVEQFVANYHSKMARRGAE